MSVHDELQALKTAELHDGGKVMEIEWEEGISDAEIAELERDEGFVLPAGYRELLKACGGFGCSYLEVDFTGRSVDFGMEDMRLASVPFASDGCGNFYVADFLPGEEEVHVFFWCHDPPAMVFQCVGMAAWLRAFGRSCGLTEGVPADGPHPSEPFTSGKGGLDWVMKEATFEVYGNPNHPLTKESMLASGDPEMVAFAETLEGDGWEAVDLRQPRVGDGFGCARYGADSEIRRSATARIFAIQKPPPKKGLFSFLRRP